MTSNDPNVGNPSDKPSKDDSSNTTDLQINVRIHRQARNQHLDHWKKQSKGKERSELNQDDDNDKELDI
jgi:hypothetical protein